MIQNSLERLFDGLVASLRDTVGPTVSDPYARAQIAAAAELLANIGTRVQWRTDVTTELIRRLRPVLEQAVAAAGTSDLPATRAVLARPMDPSTAAGLLTERAAHLAALAEVQDWLGAAGATTEPATTVGNRSERAAVAEAVRAFLVWQLDDEGGRLRTGMYRPVGDAGPAERSGGR